MGLLLSPDLAAAGTSVWFTPHAPAHTPFALQLPSRQPSSPPAAPQSSYSVSIHAARPVTAAEIARLTVPTFGPFDLEHPTGAPIASASGTNTSLVLPIKGVPGLGLVANLFTGHRSGLRAPAGSAAATVGIRWRW